MLTHECAAAVAVEAMDDAYAVLVAAAMKCDPLTYIVATMRSIDILHDAIAAVGASGYREDE